MGARGFSQLGTQVPCLLSCCRGKLDILFFGTPLDARTIGVFMATLLSSLSHIIRYRAVIRIRAWKIPGILSQALNCFNFQISTIGGILHWFWYHKRPTTPLLKRSRIRPWSRGGRAIFLSDTFFSLKSWFFLVFAFYYFFFVCVCVCGFCVCVCVCVCVFVCVFCFVFVFVLFLVSVFVIHFFFSVPLLVPSSPSNIQRNWLKCVLRKVLDRSYDQETKILKNTTI